MKKYAMETTVGIFLVFGLLCIGYMTVKLGHVSLLRRQHLLSLRPIHLGDRPESRQPREICWALRSGGWNDSPWTRKTRRRWWK